MTLTRGECRKPLTLTPAEEETSLYANPAEEELSIPTGRSSSAHGHAAGQPADWRVGKLAMPMAAPQHLEGTLRIYYESPEYECEDKPGTFASITILGDEEGPRFLFSNADQVILDLPLPVCEALMIRTALGRSVKPAFRAAQREAERPVHQYVEHPQVTPYGPRELPDGYRDTRELPDPAYSWMRDRRAG
jgi:hypothetical protein